ncbi:MAG: right-handed parallel beta-helix repeat-containing protein [Planctomycetes bacterium]|nr:right-handed parallel beta-helix repeat-containing protein [Planctomycetota bacterium]
MRFQDMGIRGASVILLTLVGCSHRGSSSSSSTVFVAPGARGNGDGFSWENSLGSLQAALQRAQPGQEIWVESGTYRPAPPAGSRTATFVLPEGVVVRGGFRGDETSLAQRAPHNPPSILDGDLNGDDAPNFQNRADNSFHVITVHDVHHTVLENFTVRGGYADGPGLGAHVESYDQGSGMQVFHAHPHVMNCRFTDNWSSNHGTINDHGGGVFEDCLFLANYAGNHGGGLYFHGDVEAHAYRCRFLANTTPGQGGGAYSRSSRGSTFEDCVFIDNRAGEGAGLYMSLDSDTALSGSYFEANIAQLGGGGLFIERATGRVQGCTFLGNEAGHDIVDGGGGAGGSGGGGIWIGGGAPTVEDCLFDSNSASLGGGVYHNDESTAVVRRCTFVRGLAYEAGGLYALQSAVTVEDCVFSDNTATGGTFSVGGGLSLYYADAEVRRCEFKRNSALLGGGGAYAEGGEPRLDACRFEDNESLEGSQGWGGGLMAGFFTELRLANCAFEGNRARRGGAVFAIVFADPTIVNSTFVANRATIDGGGLALLASTDVQLSNSIVWGNFPDQIAGTAPTLEFVCIQGGATGAGNIDLDPQFVAPPGPGPDGVFATHDDVRGDLRLAVGSPCRDAGSNLRLLADETEDLDRLTRRTDDPFTPDTGVGEAPVVDLGAFESGAPR